MSKSVVKKEDEIVSALQALLKADDRLVMGDTVVTNGWVDTGIKSLNFALSGKLDKGIPWGKMIVVAGESQSGKSFLGGRIASNAQKDGFIVVWVDTESAVEKKFFLRIGLDPTQMVYREVSSSEQLQIALLRLLKTAEKNKAKLFIVLDSLGNLSGSKELADADKEKMTSDMGNRAKSLRTALRNILPWLKYTDSILYCVNHIYISPGFIPERKMAGGLSTAYLAQQVLFLTKKKADPGKSVKVGVKVKKNREFIEDRKCEFIINFQKGLDPYDGLFELFTEFKVIKDKRGWYDVDGKSMREVDIRKDDKLMQDLISKLEEKTADLNYFSFHEGDSE